MDGYKLFTIIALIFIIAIFIGLIVAEKRESQLRDEAFYECIEILSRDWCGVGEIPLGVDSERCTRHPEISAVQWCYEKFLK